MINITCGLSALETIWRSASATVFFFCRNLDADQCSPCWTSSWLRCLHKSVIYPGRPALPMVFCGNIRRFLQYKLISVVCLKPHTHVYFNGRFSGEPRIAGPSSDSLSTCSRKLRIPSYLWGGSIIAPSAEATKPGPLRNPILTALVSTYLSFWQTSVK